MDIDAVPSALRERLGTDATHGLLGLFDHAKREINADVTTASIERFERRLVEEMAGVRVQLAETRADLRQEIAETRAQLRQEMATMGAGLRQEMASGRFELVKWCFIFWIGQAFAVAGIVGVMMRLFRP